MTFVERLGFEKIMADDDKEVEIVEFIENHLKSYDIDINQFEEADAVELVSDCINIYNDPEYKRDDRWEILGYVVDAFIFDREVE